MKCQMCRAREAKYPWVRNQGETSPIRCEKCVIRYLHYHYPECDPNWVLVVFRLSGRWPLDQCGATRYDIERDRLEVLDKAHGIPREPGLAAYWTYNT